MNSDNQACGQLGSFPLTYSMLDEARHADMSKRLRKELDEAFAPWCEAEELTLP
jgi:hypothetical protein